MGIKTLEHLVPTSRGPLTDLQNYNFMLELTYFKKGNTRQRRTFVCFSGKQNLGWKEKETAKFC